MRAPRLNRMLVLETPQKASDGAGGFTTLWMPLGVHWAEIVPGSGREARSVASPVSTQSLRITVRAHPVGSPARPQVDQRFSEGARLYRIEAVTERDAEGHYLTCRAVEEISA